MPSIRANRLAAAGAALALATAGLAPSVAAATSSGSTGSAGTGIAAAGKLPLLKYTLVGSQATNKKVRTSGAFTHKAGWQSIRLSVTHGSGAVMLLKLRGITIEDWRA